MYDAFAFFCRDLMCLMIVINMTTGYFLLQEWSQMQYNG